MNLINCLVSKPARIARSTPQLGWFRCLPPCIVDQTGVQCYTPTGSATWDVIQFRARTAILAAESRTQTMWVAGLSDCEAALADGKYFADTNYDFIDLYSASVIAVKCAISCHMGQRYNATLVISFMNVMPVLWHVPVCVCDIWSWWDVVWEKIDRVKTTPHCNWLNALSTTS